jgi:hypothetical protein
MKIKDKVSTCFDDLQKKAKVPILKLEVFNWVNIPTREHWVSFDFWKKKTHYTKSFMLQEIPFEDFKKFAVKFFSLRDVKVSFQTITSDTKLK